MFLILGEKPVPALEGEVQSILNYEVLRSWASSDRLWLTPPAGDEGRESVWEMCGRRSWTEQRCGVAWCGRGKAVHQL